MYVFTLLGVLNDDLGWSLRKLWLLKRLCKFLIKLLRHAEKAEGPKHRINVLSKGTWELIIDGETATQWDNVSSKT